VSSEGSGSSRSARGAVPAAYPPPRPSLSDASGSIRIGRYELHGVLAAGGMATVHFARLVGEAGFSRTVAVKRLHPNFAQEQEFVAMLLDEARLVARIRHPNVVPMLDVVREPNELFLVMEYVHGESMSRLIGATRRAGQEVPLAICSAMVIDALNGLHAAHEARNERGEPLGIVHRDVSPQNVIVGVDGATRVLDFGVAKASGRLQSTQNDELKGKLAYMSPQQIMAEAVDRRADVWAASVCLWEALTGMRLFRAEVQATIALKVLNDPIPPPSAYRPECTPALDAVVLRGLSRDLSQRYATARDMAVALERAQQPATPRIVGEWVQELGGEPLLSRASRIEEIESSSGLPSTSTLLATSAETAAAAQPRAPYPSISQSQFEVPASATQARLSLARDQAEQARQGRGRAGLIALAVMIAGGLVAGAVFVTRAPSTTRGPAAGAPGSALPAMTAAPPNTAAVAANSTPSASASAPTAPTAPTASTTPAAKAAPTPARAAPPRPTAKPTATAAPAQNRCDPPFTIVDGIKKPKPECL